MLICSGVDDMFISHLHMLYLQQPLLFCVSPWERCNVNEDEEFAGDAALLEWRCHTFNEYLSTEYVVGYHDHNTWRDRVDPGMCLEQMDPFSLAVSHSTISVSLHSI